MALTGLSIETPRRGNIVAAGSSDGKVIVRLKALGTTGGVRTFNVTLTPLPESVVQTITASGEGAGGGATVAATVDQYAVFSVKPGSKYTIKATVSEATTNLQQ